MRPSSVIQGARRVPLTSKQGRVNFHKGTRASYLPGMKIRTGPIGRHGASKFGPGFKILDSNVRYFVPPPGFLDPEFTALDWIKPYAHAAIENPWLGTRKSYLKQLEHLGVEVDDSLVAKLKDSTQEGGWGAGGAEYKIMYDAYRDSQNVQKEELAKVRTAIERSTEESKD